MDVVCALSVNPRGKPDNISYLDWLYYATDVGVENWVRVTYYHRYQITLYSLHLLFIYMTRGVVDIDYGT